MIGITVSANSIEEAESKTDERAMKKMDRIAPILGKGGTITRFEDYIETKEMYDNSRIPQASP